MTTLNFPSKRASIIALIEQTQHDLDGVAHAAVLGDKLAQERLADLRAELADYRRQIEDLAAAERHAAQLAAQEANRDRAREKLEAWETVRTALAKREKSAAAMQRAIEALGTAYAEFNAEAQTVRDALWPVLPVKSKEFITAHGLAQIDLLLENHLAKNGLMNLVDAIPGSMTVRDLAAQVRRRHDLILRHDDTAPITPEAA